MLQKWKKAISRFANDTPGKRFINHHKRQQQNRENKKLWKTSFYIALGILLIITGTILSIPPLMPGFIVTLAGLSLLASQLKSFSKGLDQGELLLRRAIKFWKSRRDNRPKKISE